MKIEDEILINQYGQGLVVLEDLKNQFNQLNSLERKQFLEQFLFLILQSKPKNDDVEQSILDSGLMPSYTPCVLLKKGVANHNLERLVNLPESEQTKVFVLLLSLFRIAYSRRFQAEKNSPEKWWYWDLSDENNLHIIKSNNNY